MITLTLPVPPSANDWHRSIVVRGQVRVILTAAARKYTASVVNLAFAQGVKTIKAPTEIIVHINWYRARKAGDIDKRGAIMLDALQGIAYDNDSQIALYTIERFEDKENPRMEIEISEAA